MAFPRANAPWIAPIALAGLFAAWMSVRPRAAACVGFAAGLVFFGWDFSWFGETAAALVGPFGGIVIIGPAAIEALAFALAAALVAFATERVTGVMLPVVMAAGYTAAEFLRSSGVLAAPLYQLGAAFAGTPLAPLAAYGGVYLLTFVVALLAAALAVAVREPSRRASAQLAGIVAGIALATAAAFAAWPARHMPPPTLRVAAIQGNIRQSVKWQPRSLAVAVARYTGLTEQVRAFHPAFVLWPETVVTTDLQLDPLLAADPAYAGLAADDRVLQERFAALADSLDAVIAVGSVEATAAAPYNDLFFFAPHAARPTRYRKRRLVPFAEFLPGPAWLRALPGANLVSNFGAGQNAGLYGGRLRIAPLICWESAFGDVAVDDVARDPQFFAVATDDAWFGDTDGPYAQAQLAQLRAIETGRWVVRAAATGISGVIAPDGTWQTQSVLDTAAVVTGRVGVPQPTLYDRIGPLPIGIATIALALVPFVRRRNAR